MRRFATACTLLVVLALFAVPAVAQRFLGTITGTVTDNTGAYVAGADVKVTDEATGVERSAKTDSQGSFTFPQLPLGTYSVSASQSGFKTSTKTGVVLHVADTVKVPLSLAVGQTTEEVSVEAEAIRVQSESSEVSGLVTGQQVRELPLNGRNFVQLTQLMPGVSTADNFSAKNKGLLTGVDLSVSGGGITNNLWLVDGANNNDVGSNRTILVYPSVDNIAEFKIHRNSYGSEFGQASGAQVNIVTRGGTNSFNGSVYYFGRNDVFNAANYFLARTNDKERIRRHDYGYTFGGPIVKDKVFFFWSQEWNKEKRGTVRTAFVPTAAEKAGDFSATQGVFDTTGCGAPAPVDPLTGAAFQSGTANENIIPADRLSPAGSLYMQLYADPNVPLNPETCTNWIASVNTPIDWRQESIRGDINITDSVKLMMRYTQDTWVNGAPNAGEANGLWGDDPFPAVDSGWDQPGKQAVAQLTQTLGSTAVNSIQFSYSGNRIVTSLGGVNAGLNDQINTALPQVFGFDEKTTGDQLAHPVFWGAAGYPALWSMGNWNNGQDLFALKDDFSKVIGSHSLKFGGIFTWNRKDEFVFSNSSTEAGQFWGAGGVNGWGSTTNNVIADFLLRDMTWGFVEPRTQPEAQTRWRDLEFYVGDTWKVTPTFTVDLGLRYSLLYEPFDNTNRIASFVPSLFDPTLSSPCNGLVFAEVNPCGDAGFAGGSVADTRSLRKSDKNTFAPRIGFAWDIFGKGSSVLRAAVGQFFQRERVSPYLPIASNPPFNATIEGLRKLDSAADPCGCFSASVGAPSAAIGLSSQLPNTWQWNLTWEQELFRNNTLEIGYVGSRGIHLTSTFAANQVLPQNRLAYAQASGLGDATNAAQAALRPFAELGTDANIAMFDRTGDSIYHSLQSQVRGRFGRGSHYQLSYTWSRLIDNALLNNSDGSISTDSFVDVTNPGIDRGPSELHRPHLLNASLVYLTPALAGANDFVRNVFGDWELANILVLSHGAALTVTTGTVPGLDGGPSGTGFADNNRPLRVAGVGCSSTGPLGEQILNPDAFTLAGFQLGQIGTAGRGLCYGPGNSTLDFAIYKNWNVPFLKSNFTAERLNIQFRAEMFNLFNKANFRNPSTTLDVSSACYNSGAINLAVPGAQPGVFCTTNPGFSVDGTTTTITSAPLSGSFGVADLVRDPRQIQFGLKLTF